MPATEETYYSQPRMHLVFALSSVGMMLSILWMIAADHLRPWKEFQRDFQKIERRKLEAQEREKLEAQKREKQAKLDAIDAKIKAAEQRSEEHASEIRDLDKKLR